MPYKLTEDIRVSLTGTEVLDIPAGEYSELPKVAVAHAANLKILDGKGGKEVENSDFKMPVPKDEEKKAAK